MSILVVDVGTSSVRTSIVDGDASARAEHTIPMLPSSPAPGLVELDPVALADAVLEGARTSLDAGGRVEAVGIANQRCSTVVWDRTTGEALGPGLGWQDLRTVGRCLELQSDGVRVAPNMSATKLEHLLDLHDPKRERDLCFGTVDTWIAWTLSRGSLHVTDASNAAVTGMLTSDASGWSADVLRVLRVDEKSLPRVVDSSGIVGEASALAGSPPIAALIGDQQASLVGQGCVHPAATKITFGTGAMLDVCLAERPPYTTRGKAGTFPVIAWRREGRDTWGVEAIMLAAGTNVEWLRDDLGLISSTAESDEIASRCTDSAGVWYVPALFGLGTPDWDHGARATLLGITRGTGRAEIVRAVLEGVAHRGADLVEAAERDTGVSITSLRVDGGMSANRTFVQAVADATGRSVEVSPVLEATTRGAAFLAGLAIGTWQDENDLARSWAPRERVEPRRTLDRDRWRDACERARRWIPELSSIDF